MLQFQRYVFANAARALLIIMATLSVLALLAQGLTWAEILQDNRQGLLIYMKIVGLGAPKVLALLIPLGLFIAILWTLNRVQKDAEITVVQATGMSNWQVASPMLRLACIVAVGHLVLGLWIQPTAQRDLREALLDARSDLASALIRPGQFTSSGSDLTFYARGRMGDQLQGLMISDSSNRAEVVDYLAESGRIGSVEGKPVLIMRNGQIHRPDADGDLSILLFEQYLFDLSPFVREDTDTVYEASDRYLHQLIDIDETNYVDVKSRDEFIAEFHHRLTAPLMNLVMALLAVSAILGGEYRASGQLKRIGQATLAALGLTILHLVLRAEAENVPAFIALLWIIPIAAGVAIGTNYLFRLGRRAKSILPDLPFPGAALR